MSNTNTIDQDVNKIINAKRTLYEQILTKLENVADIVKSKTNNEQSGGASEKISDNIKILGHIQLPHVSDFDKIEFRMARLSLSKAMSIEQAYKYSNIITKKSV